MASPAEPPAAVEDSVTPILRVGNVAHAAEWYQRLGFTLQFEHSSGPNFSRTEAGLTRGNLRLLLTEGDEEVTPEATVLLVLPEVEPIAQEFQTEIQHGRRRQRSAALARLVRYEPTARHAVLGSREWACRCLL